MPRSASLAALPRSAATRAVSPSLVITDITGSGGSGGLRMPLPPRLGPLSPVAPFDFFPAGAPKGGFVGFGGHADSVIGGRPPTSPDGLRRHEDGSLARNGLMPILPPSTAVGPRVVRAAASADAIDAIGPVHGFGGPGMPYLEHHSLLMKRNRSLEMAVKRMGAELSQWREEGSLREEAHRLKLAQLDARHEHEREKYEARLRAAAEESLRALEKQRAELIGQGGASEYARRQREKQIEHLTQMSARRMGRQELGRGWRAWLDLFLESRRRERVLRGAASRLLRPKLLHGYGDWKAQWWKAEEARRVAAVVAEGQREGSARVAAAQAEMAKQALLRAAEEKEERVTHLTKVAARRLGQLSMARGFGAWSGAHKEGLRRRRLLRQAGIRLTRPKVVAAYTEWREGWRAAEAERAAVLARMSLAEQVHELAVRLSAAETELRRTQAELSLTRQAAADGIAREVEISRRAHEEAARLKERRVEHLTQLAARRMGKRELAMGFESWASSYFERSRRKRVLRLAGAKLTRPKLVACYGHWRRDWTGERAELAAMSMAEMEAVLVRTRVELSRLKQAVMDGTARDEERKAREAADQERAKHARVERLTQMAVRRISKQGLARGFGAWAEAWTVATRRKRVLRLAGAKLTRPKLVACYGHWRRDWFVDSAQEAKMSLRERLELQTARLAEAEAEALRSRSELQSAREAAASGVAFEAEQRRLAQVKAAQDKERRVEHLTDMAARRMGKKELAMGWQAWSELYLGGKRRQRMLAQAGARLARPKLAAGYSHWRIAWQLHQSREASMSVAERYARDMEAARAEVEGLRAEIDSARAAALAGLGRQEELRRLAEVKAAQDKERRVEHLTDMAARRMGKKELAMGWQAWSELYHEKVHQRNLLKKAGARLTKPKLISAYAQWHADWRDGAAAHAAALAAATQSQRLAAETSRAVQAEAALAAVQAELGLARKALAESGDQVELRRQMEEQMAAEKEVRVEHLAQMAARRLGKRELSAGWQAWAEWSVEQGRRRRLLAHAGSRLARPSLVASYRRWRADWEAEQAAAEARARSMQYHGALSRREAAEAEAARLRTEGERVAAALTRERDELLAKLTALDGGAAARELDLLRELELQKERRVAQVQQSAIRRLHALDLSRGMSAWLGAYREGREQRRRLRAAAGRLTRPKLVHAYTQWRLDFEVSEAARRASERVAVSTGGQLARERELAEATARSLREELHALREAITSGEGSSVAFREQVAAQQALDKERRVEHLTQLAARRMGKRELAMGFESWASSYFERSRRKRVLRLAGAKLTRPKLVACYGHWRRDWTGERAELARLSFKGRLQLESAMLAETRAELARTRTEAETLATRLSALDGGSAAREAALTKQLEAEREKRVEGLKAVAIRRMVLKELARGWSGWFAMYEAQVQQRNLLKKAGARLTKPTMSAYYHQWRRSWEETEAASLRRGALAAELRAVELGTSHGTLAEECERLRAELAAAREAMLRGEGYEVERERRQEEREARTRERRIEHLSALAARRMGKKELAMGWQAWSELYHEKVHQKSVLRQAALRLQRPKFVWSYVRWRESWRLALVEESKLTIREQLGTERKRRADAEAAITELHSEYGVKMRELGVTVGEAREAALEYLRQLKLATRDGAEWADKCELLQAKWAEMTDEDRIGREARRLLEAQQKTEHEATEARLGRLLAEQRSQLLREAVAMRGDLEKQLHELQMALAHATALPPTKQKAPANEVSLEKVPSKEATSKDDLTSKMRASYDDFAALDADGTNDLGFEEFSRLWASKCTREGAPTPSEMEVRAIFNQLDQDHSGSVDLSEYIQWALREALDASRGRVLDLFREWDTDGSGTVDKKEFGAALKGMGFPCGKGDLDKIFGDLDQGGSGQIDYTELNESLRRAKVKKTESPRQSGSTKASPKLRAKPTRAKPSQA